MFEDNLRIKKLVPQKQFLNDKNKKKNIFNSKKETLLIFLSTYCIRCLNLLPNINKLKSLPNVSVLLFTDGDKSDHSDIKKMYSIKFDMICIDEDQLSEDFHVNIHPFFMLVDTKGEIYHKGELKTIEDLIDQISTLNQFTD